MGAATVDEHSIEHCNEVRLVGRVAAESVEVELPSGDLLQTWRLVVQRAPADRRSPRANVDVVNCIARKAAIRRTITTWHPGDIVEVEGVLRRRFFRGDSGTAQSRYEVEARVARRLARAA